MAVRGVVDVRDIALAVAGGGCLTRDEVEDSWMGLCRW